MNYHKIVTTRKVTFSIICFVIIFSQCKPGPKQATGWVAPSETDAWYNPFENLLVAEEKGKQLYDVHCWSCHGTTGLGDGAAGSALGQKPANFHDEKIRKEKQGNLFWKITTGNGNMPSFKDVLSDEQRWQLVSYIRRFSDKNIEEKVILPHPLRSDITVSYVMKTAPLPVRILQNPVTKDLYYTTFEGDVFRINNLNKEPSGQKIISKNDHGISRLQGAVFYKNSLFLCGNVDTNSKKVTRGRMVRFDLGTKDSLKMTVVFNTVNYGANKTIYDHGWNALAISPDGKYIYVNSGARTDHGEIQDNGGLFPNARDNALTSKIFRFPIDASDLYLTDDPEKLKSDGYIYAEGIRNAYDMAFDENGNLFAVVNSGDYDSPEDMFWIRQGHHYGFPWFMGGIENPQQFPGWKPNPELDSFINRFSHSWLVKYYYDDSSFPKKPAGIKFSPGVQNLGPDANEYRGHSGKVLDGDTTGIAVSTFTAHSSPLGIVFDTKKILADSLNGDGFVIRYSLGTKAPMMGRFTKEGSDLLHMHFTYNPAMDNYFIKTTRIADGFSQPTDAILVDNNLYVIEYGGRGGHIWKLTLPAKHTTATKKSTK
ncbi:MAG: c-type cytochrome [Chitinophagaceae bacterium]